MGKGTGADIEEVEEIEIEEDEQEQEQEEEGQEEGSESERAVDRGDDPESEVNEDKLRKVAKGHEHGEKQEDDESEGSGPTMIPKGRLNKALRDRDTEREARIRAEERARLLEEQIKGAENGAKGGTADGAKPVDLKALRKHRMEAMMEGDIDTATTLEEQIEAEVRRAAREDAVAEVTAATARLAFSEAVTDVIDAYPFLDSKSEAANADAIDQVVALRDRYIVKGDSPAMALRKAAEKIGPLYEPKTKKGDEDEEDVRSQRRVLSLREKLALRRNADAARRQPPALKGGQGERSTAEKVNVEEMDEDEYSKLPTKVKRELRGDTV